MLQETMKAPPDPFQVPAGPFPPNVEPISSVPAWGFSFGPAVGPFHLLYSRPLWWNVRACLQQGPLHPW